MVVPLAWMGIPMTEAGRQLFALVHESSGDLEPVRNFLDDLPDAERAPAVRCLGPKSQRALWRRADGFARLGLADMVPQGRPPLVPVRHYGRNSLLAFTRFEKRFYRLSDRDDQLGGANFQSISAITGPGYYIAREDTTRGEVLVDYNLTPNEKPEGWPAIVPNERGISRFIYGYMIDTLRRVSEHVTIGHAARHGKTIPAWFMLCREPNP